MNHTLTLILALFGISVNALLVSYLPKTGTPPPPQQAASLALDSKSNMLYFYGGTSKEKNANIWEFDLNSQKWGKLSNTSWMKPGLRLNNFMTVREQSREIVLFGGNSDGGPTSEVWSYNIEDEAVKST
jgi:hypothetical protein